MGACRPGVHFANRGQRAARSWQHPQSCRERLVVGKGPLTPPEIGVCWRYRASPMIEAVSFRSQTPGCIRTAFPVAMAALSLFLLLVSTDISQACANADKAAARANASTTVMQAPAERVVQKLTANVVYVASVAIAGISKVRTSKCCDTSSGHCGDACSKGCCAACGPAVLASGDDFTLIESSCAYVDRQGPAIFYRIPSPTFRPPRTIA